MSQVVGNIKVYPVQQQRGGEKKKFVVVANVQATFGGVIVVKSMRLMHNVENGSYFVAMPANKIKDREGQAKYDNIVFFDTKENKQKFEKLIISKYKALDEDRPRRSRSNDYEDEDDGYENDRSYGSRSGGRSQGGSRRQQHDNDEEGWD